MTAAVSALGGHSRPGERAVAAAGVVILLMALFWRLWLFVHNAVIAIPYPYELDYGEGIVWQQAIMIARGDGYGDITRYPFIVFHYTPLFHVLAMATSRLGIADPLFSGRLVSLVSTMVTVVLLAAIVSHGLTGRIGRRPAALCGAVGGLAFLVFWPVLLWAPLMRVDMLGIALSVAGLWCGIGAFARPWKVHLASLFFVAALFSKQSEIAAPAACYLVLMLARPRTAVRGLVSALTLGAGITGMLSWATRGEFLRHVFLYNINRFEFERLDIVISVLGAYAVFFGVGAMALAGAVRGNFRFETASGAFRDLRSRLSADAETQVLAVVIGFIATSSLMLVTIAKSGSNVNYLIEWWAAWCFALGWAMRDAAVRALAGRTPALPLIPLPLVSLAVPFLFAVQAVLAPPPPFPAALKDGTARAVSIELSRRIRATDKPVVSDDMVLLLKSGKEVPWEAAIFAELSSTGAWDDRPFLKMIRDQDFAFFITVGARGSRLFDARYTPRVADAIDAAYPRQETLGRFVVHSPAPRASLPPTEQP